jgi:hypothetical protein
LTLASLISANEAEVRSVEEDLEIAKTAADTEIRHLNEGMRFESLIFSVYHSCKRRTNWLFCFLGLICHVIVFSSSSSRVLAAAASEGQSLGREAEASD